VRWQALKRYIREWARQERDMVESDRVGGNSSTGEKAGRFDWLARPFCVVHLSGACVGCWSGSVCSYISS
jgi:hypothetical protein